MAKLSPALPNEKLDLILDLMRNDVVTQAEYQLVLQDAEDLTTIVEAQQTIISHVFSLIPKNLLDQIVKTLETSKAWKQMLKAQMSIEARNLENVQEEIDSGEDFDDDSEPNAEVDDEEDFEDVDEDEYIDEDDGDE